MSTTAKILSFCLFISLFFPLKAHQCVHDHHKFPMEFVSLPRKTTGRLLQVSDRDNIRIVSFFQLEEADETKRTMLQEQLIPAALSYYRATLKVNRLDTLKLSESNLKSCGFTDAPSDLINGVEADYAVLVMTFEDKENAFLAVAGGCLYDEATKRPVLGVVRVNTAYTWGTSEKEYESYLYAMIHELGHAFGFTSANYEFFVNPSTGETLQNPTIEKEVNGKTIKILTVEPLKSKLQEYFGCSTLEGAYLENEGTTGSIGSHFERRIFFNEVLSPSLVTDSRISEFFLAFLESTGWYTPNYLMAEPFFWGKGKGCDFLEKTCLDNSGNPRFPDHFCSSSAASGTPAQSCTFTSLGEGYCENQDTFSDGCPYVRQYSNRECGDAALVAEANTGETFGEGSMCFTTTSNSQTAYKCLKQECKGLSGGNYEVTVSVGDQTVTCSAEGTQSVSGMTINCPDPKTFCTTKGLKYCPRGCMGRGTCQAGGVCECDDGYYGRGCSYQNGGGSSGSKDFKWLAIVIGIALVLAVVGGVLLFKKWKRAREGGSEPEEPKQNWTPVVKQNIPTTTVSQKYEYHNVQQPNDQQRGDFTSAATLRHEVLQMGLKPPVNDDEDQPVDLFTILRGQRR